MAEVSIPEPPLHRAARLGDLAELGRLLDAGADIETWADIAVGYGSFLERLTPLMVAAQSVDGASAETVAFLLERGANVAAKSAGEVTAAWYAAGAGQHWDDVSDDPSSDYAERLRCLLDAGINASESASNGRSLIAEAAASGDPARVQLLLERGASASPSGKARYDFEIPLFCAAASGSAECVRLLLAAGAAPETPDNRGRRAISRARSPEVVRTLLLAGARLDWRRRDADALEEVFSAISSGELPAPRGFAVAQALLEAGASLERLSDTWSRLCLAAFREQTEVVAFLLEQGASLAADKQGFTPLHGVCWQGEKGAEPEVNVACERIIRMLVAAGIPIDARDDQQKTPLHKATRGDWGNVTAVRTLLELGAEVDPLDYRGRTPLHRAAEHGELDCIEALLAAGADPNLACVDGSTPVVMACHHEKIWRQIVAQEEHQRTLSDHQQAALSEAIAARTALKAWAKEP